MNWLNLISKLSLIGAVLTLPFLLFNWIKYIRENRKFKTYQIQTPPSYPFKSISLFIFSIFIGGLISLYSVSVGKNRVAEFFQNSSENYEVYVNGVPTQNSKQIIFILRDLDSYFAHHSHPTKRIDVEIRNDKKRLDLELRRDSERLQEYWVYYTDKDNSNMEIGRITTPLFDEF
jgi:hypothetical protein